MFGSRFLKIYFLDILFSEVHLLRTLFIFRLDKCIYHILRLMLYDCDKLSKSDYCPNHSMLHNPANTKQSATLQCVDCDENLSLNRVFGQSKWSFEELQIKLPQQLTIRCSRKKRNEAKNNCLMDSGKTYNRSPPLNNCFLLKFFFMN